MKILNKKSFYLIIIGLVLYTLLQGYNLIVSLTQKDAAYAAALKGNPDLTEAQLEAIVNTAIMIAAVVVVICIIVAIIMILKCLKNFKEPRSQGYITALFVISIIFLVFGVFSLISSFGIITLLSIGSSVLILVGSALQKKA